MLKDVNNALEVFFASQIYCIRYRMGSIYSCLLWITQCLSSDKSDDEAERMVEIIVISR